MTKRSRVTWRALALAWLVAAPAGAHAQSSTEFQVEIFEPQAAQGVNLLNLAKSDIMQHLFPSVGVFVHYVDDPFELVQQNDPDRVASRLIESQLKVELLTSVGLFDWIDIGLAVPFVVTQSGQSLALFNRPGDVVEGFVLQDFRLTPKLRVVNAEDAGGFGLAVGFTVYFPTGDSESFGGYGAFRLKPFLVLDWRDAESGFALVGNVGYGLQPKTTAHNLVLDDAVHWGAGVEVPLGMPEIKLLGTIFGAVALQDNVDPSQPGRALSDSRTLPIETDVALQGRIGDVVLNAGAGFGLTQGVGSPDYRVFGSVSYVPRTDDRDEDGILDRDDDCPEVPEDKDGFEDADGCPDLDNDKDGVPDVTDGAPDGTGFGACRDTPEDKDGFEDTDGCPDPDNDGDTVLDVSDGAVDATGFGACRDQPEDSDGFEDHDGCPDPDNDKDGILDREDGAVDATGFGECRDKAEDKDGFEDTDGCPDPDNDGDGVPDLVDGDKDATGFGECRDKPETVNDYADEDGCPDTKPSKVRVTQFKIEILEKVYFDYNRATIKDVSFALLNEVAQVIQEHPQLTRIRVEGHTDYQGTNDYNMKLSQARADSVRDYLIAQRVAGTRLVAQGWGEERPLIEGRAGRSKAGRAKNRRVEFVITEVNGQPHSADKPVILEKREEVTPP